MGQRFDVETNIAPPMRKAITLVHGSVVIYVAQGAFGPDVSTEELNAAARLVAAALDEGE